MRIEIDTTCKTVIVYSAGVKELIEELPKMVKDWESYTVISKENFTQPYVYQYPVMPASPLMPPSYTTCNDFGIQKENPLKFSEPIISIN